MPFGGRTASTASSGYGRLNGPYSLPKKPAVVNAFSSSPSPSLEPLADVDERRDGRVRAGPSVRAIHGAEVRRGDRLRRHVAGVPVVLVPRVQDVARGRRRMCERISVPRSITLATFSSPCEILMSSTAVSIAGKVLSTLFGLAAPISNGV